MRYGRNLRTLGASPSVFCICGSTEGGSSTGIATDWISGAAGGVGAGAARYVSRGLTRSRTDKLGVIAGGAGEREARSTEARSSSPSPQPKSDVSDFGQYSNAELGSTRVRSGEGRGEGAAASRVTSLASHTGRPEVSGTAALKSEPEPKKLSPTEQLEQLPWGKSEARAAAAEKRAEAKAKGYEGEACGECGNFTLVRNGTCMKCDTCGSTTGCS